MKGGDWKRRKMLRMWEENPRCHWCGQPTVLIFRPPGIGCRQVPIRMNEATLDHLHSRWNGERGRHAGNQTIFLACWKCNQERNREEEANLPRHMLHQASGCYPGGILKEIVNQHVGPVILTRHALDRWNERGDYGPIEEALSVAVPFGAQKGSAILLAHESVVFVTKAHQEQRIVTTVLTRDMAVAGVQAFIGLPLARPRAAEPIRTAPASIEAEPFVGGLVKEADPNHVSPVASSRPRKAVRKVQGMNFQRLMELFRLSDEDLAKVASNTTDTSQKAFAAHELARRKKLEKYKAHAVRMEAMRQAIKNVVKTVFSGQELQAFWDKVNAEEAAMGLRSAPGSPSTEKSV